MRPLREITLMGGPLLERGAAHQVHLPSSNEVGKTKRSPPRPRGGARQSSLHRPPMRVEYADGERTHLRRTPHRPEQFLPLPPRRFQYYRNRASTSRTAGRLGEGRVEGITLIRFVCEEGLQPALMKIDVEGFEPKVRGGPRPAPGEAAHPADRDQPIETAGPWDSRSGGKCRRHSSLVRAAHRPGDVDVNMVYFHRNRHACLLRRTDGESHPPAEPREQTGPSCGCPGLRGETGSERHLWHRSRLRRRTIWACTSGVWRTTRIPF